MTLEQLAYLMTPFDSLVIKDITEHECYPFITIHDKLSLEYFLIENPKYNEVSIVNIENASTGYDKRGNKSLSIIATLKLENTWKLYHFNNKNIVQDFEFIIDALSNGYEFKQIDNRLYFHELTVDKNVD